MKWKIRKKNEFLNDIQIQNPINYFTSINLKNEKATIVARFKTFQIV